MDVTIAYYYRCFMLKSEFALDRVDKKIIEILQLNARITNRDLAELVFMSPSACLKRTKKLEEQGYIRNYTLALDLSKIVSHVQVLAQIKLNSLNAMVANMRFEQRIKQLSVAPECYKVAGEFDYIVMFICRDIKHYNSIIDELMSSDIGIAGVTSNVVMSTPKPWLQYPLEELKWREEHQDE